jgi:hypothetical protein
MINRDCVFDSAQTLFKRRLWCAHDDLLAGFQSGTLHRLLARRDGRLMAELTTGQGVLRHSMESIRDGTNP